MIVFYRQRRFMVAFGGGSYPAGWCSEKCQEKGVGVAGRLLGDACAREGL